MADRYYNNYKKIIKKNILINIMEDLDQILTYYHEMIIDQDLRDIITIVIDLL